MHNNFRIDDRNGVAYFTVDRKNRMDRVPLETRDAFVAAIAGAPPDGVLLAFERSGIN